MLKILAGICVWLSNGNPNAMMVHKTEKWEYICQRPRHFLDVNIFKMKLHRNENIKLKLILWELHKESCFGNNQEIRVHFPRMFWGSEWQPIKDQILEYQLSCFPLKKCCSLWSIQFTEWYLVICSENIIEGVYLTFPIKSWRLGTKRDEKGLENGEMNK